MLLFSTTLNTTERLNKDAFVKLIFKTIRENPFDENKIPNLEWKHGDKSASFGDENLSLKIEDYRTGDTIAARFEKRSEDGAFWTTDYVFDSKESKLSIILERSFSEDALNRGEVAAPPYLIKNIIVANALEKDGDLDISYKPILVNEDNKSLIEIARQGE